VQVVKRRTISDIGIDDEVPVSGRKRPVRERLGNTVVDSDSYGSQQSNKRYLLSIYQYSLFVETSIAMFLTRCVAYKVIFAPDISGSHSPPFLCKLFTF
jgi:hypothetical protein